MSKDGDFPMSSHAPLFLLKNPHSQFPSRSRWSELTEIFVLIQKYTPSVIPLTPPPPPPTVYVNISRESDIKNYCILKMSQLLTTITRIYLETLV